MRSIPGTRSDGGLHLAPWGRLVVPRESVQPGSGGETPEIDFARSLSGPLWVCGWPEIGAGGAEPFRVFSKISNFGSARGEVAVKMIKLWSKRLRPEGMPKCEQQKIAQSFRCASR